ncbi:MAG: hypothetical protein V1735_08185 [Nanoarchaeota archaeon]
MTNPIVSVRIPQSMFEQLKERAQHDHFLDVSEAVRSMIRRRFLEKKQPELVKIELMRTEITDLIRDQSEKKNRELILTELQKIKEGLLGK